MSKNCESGETRRGGYDPSFFEDLARIEDRHFWFVCRNDLIMRIAARSSQGFGPGSLVLEAGCGTGNVLRFLARACSNSTVVGADMWSEGLAHARRRTACPLVVADVEAAPFSRRFDMICLFDVLEHIQEDERVLRQVYSMLAPGGTLFITVPAYQSLWSYFDEAAHHCRRYELKELAGKLTGAGFEIRVLTAFMASLFPVVWVGRKVAGLTARLGGARGEVKDLATQEFRIVPGVNTLMKWVIGLENRFLTAGGRLPFGTSILGVAHKPLK